MAATLEHFNLFVCEAEADWKIFVNMCFRVMPTSDPSHTGLQGAIRAQNTCHLPVLHTGARANR